MKPPATFVRVCLHITRCLIVAGTAALGIAFGCGPPASIGDPAAATSHGGDGGTTSRGDGSTTSGGDGGTTFGGGDTGSTNGCPSAHVTYTDVAPIFARYCTGCHSSTLSGRARSGAPSGINYDTYLDASADADAAVSAIRSNMPPGRRVSTADACTLTIWADEGAPE